MNQSLPRIIVPSCPGCFLSDRCYKVSLLYLEGTARLYRDETNNQPELDAVLVDILQPGSSINDQNKEIAWMVKFFAPPAETRNFTRQIHPDFLVVGFALVGLLALSTAGMLQPNWIPVFIILFFAGCVGIWIARHYFLRQYQAQKQREQMERSRVQASLSRWMRLYFCSRDRLVFDPEDHQCVPLDQLSDLLRV